MNQPPGVPIPPKVREAGVTVLEVTGNDGRPYLLKVAVVVPMVVDTGIRNPIDDTPIFNVVANVVVKVEPETHA